MVTPKFQSDLNAWKANVNGRAARWARSYRDLHCKFSGTAIHAGEAYRRVTQQDWPMCAACAKAKYGEEPPDSLAPLAPLPVPLQQTDAFSRFDRRSTASRVRHNILDARQRQAGEREP